MKKSVYKSFIILAIPIVIQQVLSQSLTFIDQIMIGHLGEEVIAAVGSAGQISFFYWVVQFGILSSGSIFIAQYHGKSEHQMVRRIFGFMTGIGLLVSVVFTAAVFIFGGALFTMLFPQSPKTVQIGTAFTNIFALTFIMTTLTNSFSTAMRSIERTKEPMIATSISIVVNIIFNILFIPRFGAIGAAYGTFLARVVELLLIFAIYKMTKNPFKGGKLSQYWITNKYLLKNIMRVSIPVVLTELIWAAATTAINLLYTQTGVSGAAASNISSLILGIQSVIFTGVASATAILIGKEIGETGREAVIQMVKKLTKLALIVSSLLVVFSYFIGIPLIMKIYTFESETTSQLTYYSLLVVSFMSFFKLLNWFLFIGVFRAGGDTKFAFYADIGFLVCYALPVVIIGIYVFHLPIYILILLAMIEEIFKSIVATWRYLSKKWIHDVTRDIYHI